MAVLEASVEEIRQHPKNRVIGVDGVVLIEVNGQLVEFTPDQALSYGLMMHTTAVELIGERRRSARAKSAGCGSAV